MRRPNHIYGVFCGYLQPKLFLSLSSARNSCSNSRVYLGEILSTEANWIVEDDITNGFYPWQDDKVKRAERLRARAAMLLTEADKLDRQVLEYKHGIDSDISARYQEVAGRIRLG